MCALLCVFFTDGVDFKCIGVAKSKVLAESGPGADGHAAAAGGIVAEEHVDVVVNAAVVVELAVFLERGQVVGVLLLVRSHCPRAPDLVL